MKILIMSDMEGVAGVLDRAEWTRPEGRSYEQGRRLLTEEVNAAAAGFFEGGATEILVVDGHGPGGLSPEGLDERLLLMRGRAETVWPWTLDTTYHGLAFVGQHAKAGTPYSHLTHTQTYRTIDMSINGVSIGEFGQLALCARELGVPTIFAAGEQALTEEAEELAPGVVTVSVKRGLLPDGLEHLNAQQYAGAKLGAIHLAPKRSRALIRAGALRAIRKLKDAPSSFGYQEIRPPFERIVRYRADGDSPAYETRDTHPTSLTALINMP